MSNTWSEDPFAFDDDALDPAAFDPSAGNSSSAGTRKTRARRAVLFVIAASLAATVVSLVMGARHAGWATVAVGTVAYLLAVASDLRERQIRHSVRRHDRPWATALLRLVVFWAAAGAAWLAASGLAGP